MPRKQFEATEGLLHDVMRKQAGSVEKAVLEAVMNSVDAGANSIDITIHEDGMTIIDDGEGMTRDEVETYFEKFGLKDDDIEEKEFGKFRMGRGQIFNFGLNVWHTGENILVVNLEEDETTITLENDGPRGGQVTLDTSGLSYNLLEKEAEPVYGCEISVQFYNNLESVQDSIEKTKTLIEFIPFMHDVSITLNDEEIGASVETQYRNDDALFAFEPEDDVGNVANFSTKTAIYNKGAYVKDENLVPVRSLILTEADLDVNFARNDILDTDENWRIIRSDFIVAAQDYLIEKRDLNNREAEWLLDQAVGNDGLLSSIRSIPLIEDINDDKWSIEQLAGEDISYSHSGDKAAQDIMQDTGVVFLQNRFTGKMDDLVENSRVLDYDDVIEQHNTFEMSHVEEDDLSKKRRDRLAQARWFLNYIGFNGSVESGFSQHADVWKDEDNTLYIHKGLLNRSKMEFLTQGLDEVLEVAAHDGSTRQERHHDMKFRRDYWNYSRHRAEAQRELLEGNADYEGF